MRAWLASVRPSNHKRRLRIVDDIYDSSDILLNGYFDYAQLVAGSFGLAVTERGFLAAVLRGVRAGDSIALLFGAEYPAVLREAGSDKHTFHGLAYVMGIMDGELQELCSPPRLVKRGTILQ